MSTDIHDKIRSEVERRLGIARAATPGPWDYHTVHPFMDGRVQARIGPQGKPKVLADVMHAVDMWHVALHDPADAIRRYERDLRVLIRHWDLRTTACDVCSNDQWAARHPCPEVTDLAESLGIDTGGQP